MVLDEPRQPLHPLRLVFGSHTVVLMGIIGRKSGEEKSTAAFRTGYRGAELKLQCGWLVWLSVAESELWPCY